MDRFRQAMEDYELSDLGFEGDVFTWRNNSDRSQTYIRERLDRAVANPSWRNHFLHVRVQNGDMYHSDHCTVVIMTGSLIRSQEVGGERPFHFEARWVEEEHCDQVVKDAWELAARNGSGNIYDALGIVAGGLWEWSVNVLGDLEKRVKKAKKDLENCRSLISDTQASREVVLRFKLERLEEQVDLYWKQRAHVKWLEKGDRNTAYFLKVCSERRRNNRIGRLKKEDGSWVEGEVEKVGFISNYFKQLFRYSAGTDTGQVLAAVM